MATSATASRVVRKTDLIERSMKTELSLAICTVTPGGRSAWILGNCWRTAFESTSGLAVACLMMPTEIASRPLSRTMLRSSWGAMRTFATSPIRTA